MAIDLSQLSKEAQEQVAEQLKGEKPKKRPRMVAARVETPGPYQGMTKTEERYAHRLNRMRWADEIYNWRFELLTLKLAKKTRYTPDFVVIGMDGKLQIHEVKGGYIMEDSWVKLKLAAVQWPEIPFYKCQWTKGEWIITQVPSF